MRLNEKTDILADMHNEIGHSSLDSL